MLINLFSNNLSFKSTPVRNVKLKTLTNGLEDGFKTGIFSKLNPCNDNDSLALEKIKETWKMKSVLIMAFCNGFKKFKEKTIHYNAIELCGKEPLEERIVSLIKTTKSIKNNAKILTIHQLASRPDFSYSSNTQRSLKGAGEIILCEIFQNAKEKNFSKINLISTNNSFYYHTFKKAGIDIYEEELLDTYNDELTIPSAYFDKYIEYCKKEYHLPI